MLVLDPSTATAVSPLPPLEGRPLPGKPGAGDTPAWAATETFFSMLTQCGLAPVVAAEPAPAATGAGRMVPFLEATPTDPEAAGASATTAPDTAMAMVTTTLAATATVAAPSAPAPEFSTPAKKPDAVALAAATPVATAPAGLWPAYPGSGPATAARPIKAPILSGYRSWTTPETVARPAEVSSPTGDNGPAAATTPAAAGPVAHVLATVGAPVQQSAAPAPAEPAELSGEPPAPATVDQATVDQATIDHATYAPATNVPAAAPSAESTAQDSPVEDPALQGPASASVESADAPVGDGGSSGQPPQGEPQPQQPTDAATAVAATTTDGAPATLIAGQLATATAAELAVLIGTQAAAGHASTGTNAAATLADPATGASIRAQLLAEVAVQSVGATGHEKITLQLEPEHLGKVQVQLQANGSRLEIVVQAQSAEAEQALADGVQELVEAIVGRGEGRWQQVEVRFERSSQEREQRQPKDESRDGGGHRRGNQQERGRDERADA